jgi:hypothetical protein
VSTPAVLTPCAGSLWAPDAELMHQLDVPYVVATGIGILKTHRCV